MRPFCLICVSDFEDVFNTFKNLENIYQWPPHCVNCCHLGSKRHQGASLPAESKWLGTQEGLPWSRVEQVPQRTQIIPEECEKVKPKVRKKPFWCVEVFDAFCCSWLYCRVTLDIHTMHDAEPTNSERNVYFATSFFDVLSLLSSLEDLNSIAFKANQAWFCVLPSAGLHLTLTTIKDERRSRWAGSLRPWLIDGIFFHVFS